MSFVVHKVQVTDKVLAVINVPTGATQEKTVLLLTHGAGSKKGTVEKNLLPVLAAKVSALGVPVVRVEAFGRVETRFKALQQVDQRLSTGSLHASLPAMPHVVPGGTSMGSRAAAMHAAAEPSRVRGVVLIAYPLKNANADNATERERVFLGVKDVPALLVRGTKDTESPDELWRPAVEKLAKSGRVEELKLEGGNHSVDAKNYAAVSDAVARFVMRCTSGGADGVEADEEDGDQ